MKKRNAKGDIIESRIQGKNHTVLFRVSDDEYNRIKLLQEQYGYYTVSSMMRDILFRKQLVSQQQVFHVTDELLREKMNRFIFEVNKIGVNYNQFVATYQRQAKMTGADGKPYLTGKLIENKVDALMRMTEGMRDEVAVIIDIFKKYSNHDGEEIH